jgi:hypothetical protein
VHCALGLSRPARLSGPAYGLAWHRLAAHGEDRGGKIPSNADGSLAKFGRPAAVGQRGSSQGATRSTVILIWGEGRQEAHHGGLAVAMAIGRRGAPVRGSVGCRWLGW